MRLRRRRATLPRSGCTSEQIEAGCMWRDDLKRCQCPTVERIATTSTPASKCPPGTYLCQDVCISKDLKCAPFLTSDGGTPTGDRTGSIAVYPKLQTRTVKRRYTKRRPGEY